MLPSLARAWPFGFAAGAGVALLYVLAAGCPGIIAVPVVIGWSAWVGRVAEGARTDINYPARRGERIAQLVAAVVMVAIAPLQGIAGVVATSSLVFGLARLIDTGLSGLLR